MRPRILIYAAVLTLWALAAGCASTGDAGGSAGRTVSQRNLDTRPDYGRAIAGFSSRVAASRAVYASDDVAGFLSARDSLLSDVNDFIRDHPHAEQD
ncbi:MAG: hypothetical protein L0Z51_05620, partial [Candidatus Latescibacteria bacterium]|nr:hypothetical protein [Candidatus Latescibacterota bacterium]